MSRQESVLQLTAKAKEIVARKTQFDTDNQAFWRAVGKAVDLMVAILGDHATPTRCEKQNIGLAEMVTRYFPSAEDSQDPDIITLCQLGNQFCSLDATESQDSLEAKAIAHYRKFKIFEKEVWHEF